MSSAISDASGSQDLGLFRDLDWNTPQIEERFVPGLVRDFVVGRLSPIPDGGTEDKVVQLWRRVESEKDPKVMVALGKTLVFSGRSRKRDFAKACTLFNDAADLGEGDALYLLSWMVVSAKENKAVRAAVLEKVQKGAENNNPGALCSLELFESHAVLDSKAVDAVSRDLRLQRITKAAGLQYPLGMVLHTIVLDQTGHRGEAIQSCNKLIAAGHTYGYVLLSSVDRAHEEDCLRMGADAGDIPSTRRLASLLEERGSVDEAIELYRRGAERGDIDSMFALAQRCQPDRRGGQALYWLKRILEDDGSRDGLILCLIGGLYRRGFEDLGQDLRQAEDWLKNSASEGFPYAAKTLGDMCRKTGNGVQAVDWYKKALEWLHGQYPFDIASVENSIAEVYQIGLPDLPADHREAVKWYKKAAQFVPAAYVELKKYITT